MKKKLMTVSAATTLSILLTLSLSLSVSAFSGVTGNWVMTQAAAQSQGKAPTVIACGTFALNVASSADGAFTGSIAFSLTNSIPNRFDRLTIPGLNDVPAELVSGTILTPPNGALFVSFSGIYPVPLFGSFASPSFQPSPSIDPTQLGCPPITGGGFLGLVHLPGQGTEGMTIYSYT